MSEGRPSYCVYTPEMASSSPRPPMRAGAAERKGRGAVAFVAAVAFVVGGAAASVLLVVQPDAPRGPPRATAITGAELVTPVITAAPPPSVLTVAEAVTEAADGPSAPTLPAAAVDKTGPALTASPASARPATAAPRSPSRARSAASEDALDDIPRGSVKTGT